MKLVAPPADFVSTAVTLLHAADSDNGALPLRHLSDALAAAAQACARNRDTAGFDAALGDWLWLCRTSNRTANTLVGQLVAQAMISGPAWVLVGCGAAPAISPGFRGRDTRSPAGRLPGRLAITPLALAAPALGWESLLGGAMNGFFLAGVILLGLPLLWLLVQVVKMFLVSSLHPLRRSTVGQAAATAWVFAMLPCGIALPLHHAEERYWTQRDQVMAVPTDSPSFSTCEARVAEQLHTGIEAKLKPLEALDPD